MNNRLFDTNIGSLDFQPMPKRFMVWDKERKQFWTLGDLMPGLAEPAASETRFNMSDMIELSKQFKNTPLTPTRSIICQSTNQFDKDRKEIFEGSIVYCESDDEYGYVEYDHDEGKYMVIVDNIASDFSCGGDYYGVVGHILSNPELLGSENV